MNYYVLIPFSAFSVNLFLIALIFARSRKRPESIAYMLFAGDIALWELSEFFLWSPLPDGVIDTILRATAPLYLAVGVLFLNFALVFVGRRRNAAFFGFCVLALSGIALSAFTNLVLSGEILRTGWGTTPKPGPLLVPVQIAAIVLPAYYGLAIVAGAWHAERVLIRKKQLGIIFFAFFSASAASVLTNMVLSALWGPDAVPHLASSLLGFGSLFIFIGMAKYRLMVPGVEEFSADIFSGIHDCVMILRGDGSIAEINDAAIATLGLTRDGLPVLHISDIFHADYSPGEDYRDKEVRLRLLEEEQIFLLSQSSIRRGDPRSPKLIIMKDITGVKRAGDQLAMLEERFSKAFHSSPVAMCINSLVDGRYVDVNAIIVRDAGYSREEFLANTIFSLNIFASKAEFDRYMEFLTRDGRLRNFECLVRIRTGEIITALFFSERIVIGGEKMVISSVLNITEKKKMEAELLKMSRIESLGTFAGGIAHDFNNLLTAIMGNITLARLAAGPEGEADALLGDAEKASLRAKDLTQQLLTFSKGGAPLKKTMSVVELLRDSSEFALSGSRSKCRISIEGELANADIDGGQISQVIHNLVLNASQAMPEGGIIGIDAGNFRLEGAKAVPLPDGDYLKISVVDRGHGIPADIIGKIFDPFFTTKHSGNGLGLAVSWSIVKRHGGHITVESGEGRGARFDVYLPASGSAASEPEEDRVSAPALHRKVLVMDDEPMVLDVAARMLRRMNYTVETAVDGDTAIARYRAARGEGAPFDCVIMDLTIPGGMGGSEAVRELRKIDPGIVAVVSSGYSKDPVIARYREHGFAGVLEKPYRMEMLRDVVERVCRGAGEGAAV